MVTKSMIETAMNQAREQGKNASAVIASKTSQPLEGIITMFGSDFLAVNYGESSFFVTFDAVDYIAIR